MNYRGWRQRNGEVERNRRGASRESRGYFKRNARLTGPHSVHALMVASEQNRMLSIVTPSDVLDCEACCGDPSLPYADRVFAGTPFADAVNAIAKSAAPPPITVKIFMWPPRFRQECLEVSQHFHVQPRE